MSDKPICPGCESHEVRKHGQHIGKQRWHCKSCGLAFTGSVYPGRPENEVRTLKQKYIQLFKLVHIAMSMRKAQNEHLMKPCAKTLIKKQMRESRFDEPAAKKVSSEGTKCMKSVCC